MRSVSPLLLLILLVAPSFIWAEEPVSTKPQRYQQLLARECDDLLRSAVKRPYGWAWSVEPLPDVPAKTLNRTPVPVSLEPATTPAAGLILLYAADVLGEPKYADAARHVGRGVAAAQQGPGKFPAGATFGPTSVAIKERPAPLPDRAPTRAALALLLTLMDTGGKQQANDAIGRAAPRAASWLMRQQAESGAWPIVYPPGATPEDTSRIVRLDTPDTRDSTIAMLLAYEVLGDPQHRRAAERAIDFLMKARTGAGTNVGAGLWSTAFTPGGTTFEQAPELPAADFDALASRYAAQTLFASWVILGDGPRLSASALATQSLDALMKGEDGQWHRRFDAKGAATDRPVAAKAGSLFGTAEDAKAVQAAATRPVMTADPEYPATAQSIATGQQLGREKFRDRLNATLTPKQHLAVTLAGLSDGPMAVDLPTTREEADGYLKRHEEQFRLLTEARPTQLADKIRQIWMLYLRARVEKQFEI